MLAIGSPLGLDQSVTAGIISGKGKVTRNVHMSGERMREYIQTDAKINPGNSGGPLVNLQGEVIGINTLINVGPGGAYGFAIPINQARQMAKSIITDGRVHHAWMGVGIGDIKNGVRLGDDGEPEQKQEKASKGLPAKGAWVSRVMPNSPADKAGVHVGDVITQIDGQKIEDAADVVDYVAGQKVGAKLTVALLRDGKASKSQVILAEFPANPYAMAEPQVKKEKIGVQLQTLTPEMASPRSASPLTPRARSLPTWRRTASRPRRDFEPEDLIVEVDRKQVAGADEAAAALHASGKATHLLKVLRAGAFLFVTVAAQ